MHSTWWQRWDSNPCPRREGEDVSWTLVCLSYLFMSCPLVPCYVRLCYVMLRYVTLCYVTLCYAMLRYVMLCYVMLCYIISRFFSWSMVIGHIAWCSIFSLWSEWSIIIMVNVHWRCSFFTMVNEGQGSVVTMVKISGDKGHNSRWKIVTILSKWLVVTEFKGQLWMRGKGQKSQWSPCSRIKVVTSITCQGYVSSCHVTSRHVTSRHIILSLSISLLSHTCTYLPVDV